MRDVEGIQRQGQPMWQWAFGILVCVALFGMMAWAQKNSSENQKGVTLADLGVTEAQRAEIEALWELKRQKQIRAIADLKTLNRLVRDSLAGDAEIQERLDAFRAKRKAIQEQIDEAEDALIETLPPRAQLHLTVLGVLDNGIPRKMTRAQTRKKPDENTTSSPEQGTQ